MTSEKERIENELSDEPKGEPLEEREHHVPYARMPPKRQREEAPSGDASAGQGLSG